MGENEKESKVTKMVAMVNKAVVDLKKACKKAKDGSWGGDVLQALMKSRDELEDLATDGEAKLMVAAAAALRLSRH